jgi:adenylate cyclase
MRNIEAYEFGLFRLDLVLRQLFYQYKHVPLSQKSFEVLRLLLENKGLIVKKEEFIRHIWRGQFIKENNLAVRVSELRKILREGADSRFIETVSGNGYRFVGKVQEIYGVNAESGDSSVSGIAILPLIDESREQNLKYYCDDITEKLINSLGQSLNKKVIGGTLLQYKDENIDPLKIGKRLGVQRILVGRINREDDLLTVSIKIIDTERTTYLWEKEYERSVRDLFGLADEISREVAERLKIKLRSFDQRLPAIECRGKNLEAHNVYLKGRYLWNKRTETDFKKAIKYFQRSIKIDPDYAPAYVGLADCYNLLLSNSFLPPSKTAPKINELLNKALSIDPNLSEAYASLGYIKLYYDWDFPGAEAAFKKSISLNPNYVTSYHWYAKYLMVVGQFRTALIKTNEAKRLDPHSLRIDIFMCGLLYFSRDYDNAIACCAELLGISPNLHVPHLVQGAAYIQKGMYENAVLALKKAFSLCKNEEALALLGYANAVWNKKHEAMEIVNILKERLGNSYAEAAAIGIIYTGLHEIDNAFDWFERAYRERNGLLLLFKIDPRLDALREDERFIELSRKIGFV